MGLLRGVFGPSRDEIWRQLADQVGGQFVEGGFLGNSKVTASVGEWIITLDTYTVSTGQVTVTYTRMRAPYVNADGFRFQISRAGFFTGLGKLLGMQDIEVGHLDFDQAFVIKGNDEAKVRRLFANRRIRHLLREQPAVSLTVKNDEGWFGKRFPEGVDELHFQRSGVVKDLDQLHGLFELFAEVLNHLCHIGSAYEDDPQIEL